ncbi:hypothetical protein ABBQ32_003173 [Trebouxia sp. C0010 RCD-2024]
MYAGWSGRSLPHGHQLQKHEIPGRCGGKLLCGHARTRARPHSKVLAVVPQQQAFQAAAAAARSKRDAKPGNWFFTQRGQQDWVDAIELREPGEIPELLRELGIKYDPDRLAQVLKTRPGKVRARAVQITASVGAFMARLLRDYATGSLEQNMHKRAVQLRELLTKLGPSFVKVGQALSSRPDLLPKEYLEVLSDLQDRLQPFPTTLAMAVIEQELQASIGDVFSQLSAEPVAAASLGQVYKGVLRSTGEVVAVKVQRPGIGDHIAIDMLLLRRLMGVIDKNQTLITQPLVPLVDEFAQRLFGELDYIQEGKSCEKFAELYAHVPRVRTPGIHWSATARRVLCMEWIDGVKLTDKPKMDAAGLNIIDFVDVGIECTLRQLLEHGYFHADPHPGNLLATTSGDLVYLDFGMMSDAPQGARYAIIAHVIHLVNRDYEAMCRDYYTLDFMDPSVDTTPIAPALAAFFDNVLGSSVSQLNFKAIVDGLGGVLFQYPFRVPAYYALILRSLTVLEGLALSADPNYKLLGRAYPYMARRLLTDPAPQLRASFEELVLAEDGGLRWSRLENLMEESSKSVGYDASQLWLLADWLVGESGRTVRKPLCHELVRLIDALVADDVRRNILQRTGSQWWADRLVPVLPGDTETVPRARMLQQSLQQQWGTNQSLSQGNTNLAAIQPEGAGQLVANLQARLQAVMPRFREILNTPGAVEIRAELTKGLVERSIARAIRLVFNQDQSSAQSQQLGRRPQGGLKADVGRRPQGGLTADVGRRSQGGLTAGASQTLRRL